MTKALISYGGDFQPAEGVADALRSQHPQLTVLECDRNDVATGIEAADICIGFPGPDQLARLERLRWLQLPSAGADGWIDRVPAETMLSTASGTYGVAAAEHALGLILGFTRDLHSQIRRMADRSWQKSTTCRDLTGSTAVVVGFGDIGRETGRRLKALGVRVIGVRRRVDGPCPDEADEMLPIERLDGVLGVADILILALPGTSETAGILGADRFARCKRGALLINLGRGACVDQDALLEALDSGHLAGAGLDVTNPEPLPAEHPLWAREDVILTAHSVNSSSGKEDRRRQLIAGNVALFLDGQRPRNLVDRQRGY